MLSPPPIMPNGSVLNAKFALFELRSDPSFATRRRMAVRDVCDGLGLVSLAWTLAWLDIRLRYRGSVLGPFWLTLSTGVMVGALGYMYSGIFHTDIQTYLPFVALSLVLWSFISTSVAESCTAFTDSENVIRAIRMPFFLFALRVLLRNLLVLGHNILVIVVVFAIFRSWPGWLGLLAIPGLLVWALDAIAMVLALGTFCARFRDILPIVGSIMQIAFFVTPVFWHAGQLGRGQYILPLNPFYDLLEIVRAPLLNSPPSEAVWAGAICYSLVLFGVAALLFTRARNRIAFWI
jgi:lipopolysaccharide transport system permease protein